ncbi:MAG: NUDIX hydrolase [Proteobacteria bacterium]|nr:NUDIX hydrolase [Pseudomonadota bacterium]
MRRSLCVTAFLSLMACGEAPPPCSSNATEPSARSAGCLVPTEGGVLLVKDWSGEWALPGGSVKKSESARCGAEREVFEETGLTVQARELAAVFDNGFHLYWCTASSPDALHIHRPFEVREVAWLAPDAVPESSWRYPGQGEMITDLITGQSPK